MRQNLAVLIVVAAIGLLGPMSIGPMRAEDRPGVVTVAPQTVVFAVDNMTCALCPVTVRTAMAGVAGVTAVEVDFEAKTATVEFDSAITSADSIAEASGNAGYPAHLVE